jgi:transglutaminase-like putative cysteine protease
MDPLTARPYTVDMPDPRNFLLPTDIIDCDTPSVREKARELATGCDTPGAVAERCFLFVRDEIRHSADHRENPVTLKASEVLAYRTGFCFAKSHLLAALLRANGIPAGLCYQRLVFEGIGRRFALHGLNALYLPEHGWYRVDARGNRPGIDARFAPPAEHLAFIPREPGERDVPGIVSEPFPEVTDVLRRCHDFREVLENLPDRPGNW